LPTTRTGAGSRWHRIKDALAKALFGLALLLVAFALGVITTRVQLFPHDTISTALKTFNDLSAHWKNDLGLVPTRHLKPARHPGQGVTIRKPAKMQPGLTFMVGFFDDGIAGRLIDADGKVVHAWPIRFTEIWPEIDADADGTPVTDWNALAHGAMAFPDGSILFTIGQSLVKLDACGEVVWKDRRNYHHSVDQADDGTFWVPLADHIAHVSADGELLDRIWAQQMMERNGLEGVYFVQNGRRARPHPNDVEILSAELAPAFPLFEAGDAVYSMRDLNLIIVFDPETRKVKWFQHGPWLRQHDPDFLPDGRISIFNNRRFRDASNIIAIDPVTRETEILYQGTRKQPFFSDVGGKHQHLANGNILITSFTEGRVFEVTPEGEIVWQFINRYDEDRVLMIGNAIRYDESYFDRSTWPACPAGA